MTIAARTRAGCRWRIQPPSGRETTPRTSVREPIAPAASLERADSRSSRVTTQFAITTLSPNEAAKTTASRRSALSRARASSGARSDAPRGTCAGRGAAASIAAAAAATTTAVTYGVRQPSVGSSAGTTANATPPPAVARPP